MIYSINLYDNFEQKVKKKEEQKHVNKLSLYRLLSSCHISCLPGHL